MKTLFICYPKCSTCQKAKKHLIEAAVEFEEQHIVNSTPTSEQLKKYHEMSGLPLKRLFNTSGNSYKALNLKDKFDSLSDQEAYDLLASDGMLIKRPILVLENQVFFGYNKEQWPQ